MDDFSGYIFVALLIAGLVYIIFLHPTFEKKRDSLIFDNRVIAFIDGLYFIGDESGVKFGCTASELRNYAKIQLAKAHKLPGNQYLIEYTTKKGWRYCSHTGISDYPLFSILCVVQYAVETDNEELVEWCESKMHLTRFSRLEFV